MIDAAGQGRAEQALHRRSIQSETVFEKALGARQHVSFLLQCPRRVFIVAPAIVTSVLIITTPRRRDARRFAERLAPGLARLDDFSACCHGGSRGRPSPAGRRAHSFMKACTISWIWRSPARMDGPGDRMSLAVDLVDPALPDRAHRVPARPAPDGVDVDGLAAPRRQDDLGVAPGDLLGGDDALRRRRRGPAARGRRRGLPRSRRSPDTQRMPAISGSGHSSKKTRGRSGHTLENSLTWAISSRMSSTMSRARASRPSTPPTMSTVWKIVVDGPLVGAEHRHARPDELRADVGLEVGEGEDQVRRQSPRIRSARNVVNAADLRLVARLGRAPGRSGHADHPVPRPEGVADLHVLRAEADDASRELGRGLAVHRPYDSKERPSAETDARRLRRPRRRPVARRRGRIPTSLRRRAPGARRRAGTPGTPPSSCAASSVSRMPRAPSASPHSMSMAISASCLAGST